MNEETTVHIPDFDPASHPHYTHQPDGDRCAECGVRLDSDAGRGFCPVNMGVD